ncbi:nitroreductase [Cupriavidus lacunae]|uniref:Nitroreductase n=2 Tax=Cupriavidus lacunae TaxID=2666307 RepID=A0A370NJX0_9BURK|nr:nitroreductase [Cupriavidus lacunae]
MERLHLERHSCRGFLAERIPAEVQEKMFGLAQRTASWCNSQPWQVIVTNGQATERFRAALQRALRDQPAAPDFAWPREYRGVYQERRRACGLALYESVGVKKGDREASARQAAENYRLFGAPHVAIVTTDEALGVYGAIDCGAYVANLMLVARSLGIACVAQAALASHPEAIRQHFGLSANRLVVCGLSFGYEDSQHNANGFRTSRSPLSEAVTWREE